MKRCKQDKIVLTGQDLVKDNYCGPRCLTRRQTQIDTLKTEILILIQVRP